MPGWAPHDPERIHKRRWLTLATLCTSLLLVVLGNSILNVALPTLVRELGATATQLQWLVDGYALVFGGLLLTMGAVGDRFGRRGALQAGLTIFGLASIAALFVTKADPLIVARGAMGIGAALVMPATLSILATVFPPHERGKAFGIWAAFAGLGGAIGPVVGGWLLEHFSWPSIFVLNLPVILLGLGGSLFLVPSSRDEERNPLDPTGALLSIIALGSLLYGIIEGPDKGWSSVEVLVAFGIALVAWPVFVLWEFRAKRPMLPMQYFRDRRFSTGNATIALTFFAMFAFFFIMTQYLQFLRGYSPLVAGVRTLPLAVGLIVSAPNSDRLAKRFGTPATASGGLFVLMLALLSLALVGLDTPYWILAVSFLFTGLGMGTAMAPSTTIIMDAVPRQKAGVGSAMNDTSREVGGALGIAVLGSILNSVYKSSLTIPAGISSAAAATAKGSVGAAFAVAKTSNSPALLEAARHAFLDGIHAAYLTATVVTLITAVFVAVFMPRRSAASLNLPVPRPSRPVQPAPTTGPLPSMVAPPARPTGPRGVATRVAEEDPARSLTELSARLQDLDERLRRLETRRPDAG